MQQRLFLRRQKYKPGLNHSVSPLLICAPCNIAPTTMSTYMTEFHAQEPTTEAAASSKKSLVQNSSEEAKKPTNAIRSANMFITSDIFWNFMSNR